MDFRCVHLFLLLKVHDQYVSLPDSSRVQDITEEYPWEHFLSKLIDSGLVFRGYGMIFNQWTKWDDGSSKWFTKTPFVWCFPIRQSVLNIAQVAVTFHGIRPSFFVQSRLQQYRRCPFFYSANCSFSNPICFWTVSGWRAMIPRQVCTGFAKIQGIVSVNDFWLPRRLQEKLLRAPFCFLRSFSFGFTRIRLNPLSS